MRRMEGGAEVMIIEQVVGAAIVLIFLADIFLTVLYARAGTGLLAPRWNRLVWVLLRSFSEPFGRYRGAILSFGGPLIVILLIVFWALGLTVGAALIIQPELGGAIRPSSGNTPRDFVTALLAAGNSLSIVGSGDYSPHTSGTRILYLINSLIGASVLSLVLSYLVQVYSALRERNALALTVDTMTDCTGAAARALSALGSDGKFQGGYSELANLASSLERVKEAHHFYPLLFYFRFPDPRYSVSRVCFVVLDLATLIHTALDQERLGWLAKSSAVTRLRHDGNLLLKTLEIGLPTLGRELGEQRDQADRAKAHYRASCHELERTGLAAKIPDESRYLAERHQWERRILSVAPVLGYTVEDVTSADRSMPTERDQEPAFSNSIKANRTR